MRDGLAYSRYFLRVGGGRNVEQIKVMRRKRRAEGRVKDAEGVWWEVGEYRGTKHGFDVLLGWREGGKKGRAAGRSQVILTQTLMRHLEHFRMNPGKADLPLCWAAIRRVREQLGHHVRLDIRKWWEDRRKDLVRLSGFDFAAKHGKSPQAAHYTHRVLIGKQHHPNKWWTSPSVLAALSSGQPDAEIAATLGISPSSVRRLRSQCRAMDLGASFARRIKPRLWWKADEVQRVMHSGKTYIEMAATLGIGMGALSSIIRQSRDAGLGPTRRQRARKARRN